jgi:hypothetical protein
MTPGQRKTMYLNCLRAAERILTFEHSPQWGAGAWRAFHDARSVLAGTFSALATVTPAPNPPPAILRSEVEGVAMNLAVMASEALHPARPTVADEALMGVIATLRRALAEIAKETP